MIVLRQTGLLHPWDTWMILQAVWRHAMFFVCWGFFFMLEYFKRVEFHLVIFFPSVKLKNGCVGEKCHQSLHQNQGEE